MERLAPQYNVPLARHQDKLSHTEMYENTLGANVCTSSCTEIWESQMTLANCLGEHFQDRLFNAAKPVKNWVVWAVMKPGTRQAWRRRRRRRLVCVASVCEISESLPYYHTAPDRIKTCVALKHLEFWRLYCPIMIPSFETSDAEEKLSSPSEQSHDDQVILGAWLGRVMLLCLISRRSLTFCCVIHHALHKRIGDINSSLVWHETNHDAFPVRVVHTEKRLILVYMSASSVHPCT